MEHPEGDVADGRVHELVGRDLGVVEPVLLGPGEQGVENAGQTAARHEKRHRDARAEHGVGHGGNFVETALGHVEKGRPMIGIAFQEA